MDSYCFEQTKAGAALSRSGSTSIYQTVPDSWDGLSVVAIGRYAFSGQTQLQRVTLPASVHTIDNHAFYNCTALEQLYLGGGLRSVGDGAFKNCRRLHDIYVYGLTWLKSIVTDFTNELTLHICTEDGQTILLLFPEYDYAFQEVIPPREFRSVTYGSGSFYRMCVSRTGIDFYEYDKTFSRAVREDDAAVVQRIALYRLQYPYQLRESAKQMYLDYLRENCASVAQSVLTARNTEQLSLLLSHDLLTREALEQTIAAASDMDYPEGVSLLMDYRLSHYGRPRARSRFAL